MIDSDVLAASVAPGTTPEAMNMAGLTAGNYWVDVVRYGGKTHYSLMLTADATGNTLNTACKVGSLSNAQSFRDFIGSTDLTDFYRLSLSLPSNFSLNLNELSADADVYLAPILQIPATDGKSAPCSESLGFLSSTNFENWYGV